MVLDNMILLMIHFLVVDELEDMVTYKSVLSCKRVQGNVWKFEKNLSG